MASMWRKAMLYLGLGPDDEYDDFDVTGEHQRPVAPRPVVRRPTGSDAHHDPEPSGSVRTLVPSADDDLNGAATNGVHRTDRGRPDRERDRGDRGERDRGEGRGDAHDRGRPPAGRGGDGERDRATRVRSAVVRPLPVAPSSKPFVIGPTSFNDAQEVADRFKTEVPVILNLQGVERDLARRIIDFASGLCYGLGGQMERVANQVYLLTPSDVEVSPEERRRLRERGYEA
ncbi:MAG TPA: cell division protein SepF [Acidimicrobiales bacterium]|nr:cell division protein SepF [Acidimicrobiales bacterium]